MKLTQLQYFCEVYRQNSVSRAAELLNISQPSISAAIRELETEFGIPLFLRKGRGIYPTPEGDVFYKHSQGLLSHTDSFRKAMTQLSEKEEIQLGIPPMIGSLVLPILYGKYQSTPQNCVLRIIEGGRQSLIDRLENYQLDMALLPHDAPLTQFETQSIGVSETTCCVSRIHPLRKKSSISVFDLAAEPLVLFTDSFFQTEQILARFHNAGLTPNVLLQSNQLSTVSQMIARNIAVGFVIRNAAYSIPDLIPIPLLPKMSFSVSLAWNPDSPLTPGKQMLIDLFSQIRLD